MDLDIMGMREGIARTYPVIRPYHPPHSVVESMPASD